MLATRRTINFHVYFPQPEILSEVTKAQQHVGGILLIGDNLELSRRVQVQFTLIFIGRLKVNSSQTRELKASKLKH